MSKQHRTEVIKILRQQMEEATDPKTKVELAKQLAKLLPRPRQARRPRRAEAKPAPSNKKAAIIDWYLDNGLMYSDREKVINWIVDQLEKRRKEPRVSDSFDLKAEYEKLVAGLCPRDRAALESRNTDEVA
jgi:hypothetical protein